MDYLDRIIEEQAAYYGLTPEDYKDHCEAMAALQELAEQEGWA